MPDGTLVVVKDDGLDTYVAQVTNEVRHQITAWDPPRVLAECESKRRIVAEWREGDQIAMRPVLIALARPYAGRPGWSDEWAPED